MNTFLISLFVCVCGFAIGYALARSDAKDDQHRRDSARALKAAATRRRKVQTINEGAS